jgi:hypothetical protein
VSEVTTLARRSSHIKGAWSYIYNSFNPEFKMRFAYEMYRFQGQYGASNSSFIVPSALRASVRETIFEHAERRLLPEGAWMYVWRTAVALNDSEVFQRIGNGALTPESYKQDAIRRLENMRSQLQNSRPTPEAGGGSCQGGAVLGG